MRKLSNDEILRLAHAKTYEEFLVNKDLLGFKDKKLCQTYTAKLLLAMSKMHKNANLACKLVDDGKHITIGNITRRKFIDAAYYYGNSIVTLNNEHQIYDAIMKWFPPY